MCKSAQCALCIYGCKDMIPSNIPCQNIAIGMTLEDMVKRNS